MRARLLLHLRLAVDGETVRVHELNHVLRHRIFRIILLHVHHIVTRLEKQLFLVVFLGQPAEDGLGLRHNLVSPCIGLPGHARIRSLLMLIVVGGGAGV